MNAQNIDSRVSVFASTDEELAYNAWLSDDLDKRAKDPRPLVTHEQVGLNLNKLLEQLKKKAA